jgi:hypothetical protein
MNTPVTEMSLPWYREFWFWMVFGPLIFIILLCSVTVSLAFNYADDVVTDNYYKQGLMINQTLKQDQVAAALRLSAQFRFDRSTGEILVALSGKHSAPKNLILFLDNPVKSNQDQSVLLAEIAPGQYRGAVVHALEYSWYLALVPGADTAQRKQAEWLLNGRINLAKSATTQLQPRASIRAAE